MPIITLRLRLSIAALTLAAALGGAFLVSSAPAQTQATQQNPHLLTAQERQYVAERNQDLANLKAIGQALVHYEENRPNLRLPDAKHWMDQIAPYLPDPTVLFDPFQPGKHRYGYAFNRNCSDKSLMYIDAPAETVAVFDSTLGTRNASDTGASLRINPGLGRSQDMRITPTSDYGFVDGHVKSYRQGRHPSFSLKGGQPTAFSTSPSEVRPDDLQIYAAGNVRIHGMLSSSQGVVQAPAPSNSQLDQAQFLAGLTPVQGPGVVVTLQDSKKPFPQKMPAGMAPPNLIHDIDINQVVNELKSGGAEAISINGQRLVATSAVRMAGPTIFINNTLQAPPFVIEAIGDSKTLLAVLSQTGGIASQIKSYDKAMFSVQQAATLTLPAYTGGDEPRYARPVTEGANQNRQDQLNTLLAERAALQAKYDKAGQAFSQYERAFDTALRQALPQSSARTFAKARNLEFGIGWNAADLAALEQKEMLNPETRRDPALAAERQNLTARLAQMRDEEGDLFPKDAEAQQYLAQVHTLALHHLARPLRLQVGAVEIELLSDEIQRLR